MMKLLILASLLTSIAAAAPSAPTPPPAPPINRVPSMPSTCKQAGDVLFESAGKPIGANKVATNHVTLWANGAWSFAQTNADGAAGRQVSGCLADDKLVTVRTALTKAPWQIKHWEVSCAAIGTSLIEYSVRGKLVYTDAICSADELDADSTKKLAEVVAIFAELSKPSAIETSRGKP
jgi:hypothetical protein